MKKRHRNKEYLKLILAIIFIVAGIVGGIYVGLWLMFIKSIMAACAAFDAGCLTATLVGITVLKCVFAGTVGMLFVSVGCGIGKIFLND
jgi:hypothetical protein